MDGTFDFGVVTHPEPSSALTALGILAIGGIAVLLKRRRG